MIPKVRHYYESLQLFLKIVYLCLLVYYTITKLEKGFLSISLHQVVLFYIWVQTIHLLRDMYLYATASIVLTLTHIKSLITYYLKITFILYILYVWKYYINYTFHWTTTNPITHLSMFIWWAFIFIRMSPTFVKLFQ